jgi:hypothetical protein
MTNLLQSRGGISLTTDLCLMVIEQAIDLDPKLAGALLLVSKVSTLLVLSSSSYAKSNLPNFTLRI